MPDQDSFETRWLFHSEARTLDLRLGRVHAVGAPVLSIAEIVP